MKKLSSETITLSDYDELQRRFIEEQWTDGLPIVPPTVEKVGNFLELSAVDPDYRIAVVDERNRAITAEMVAVSCVMAGCLPEYMPVVMAGVEAIAAPEFKFNHIASMSSPWPLLIASGPICGTLQCNHDMYPFAGGDRATLSIGRAMSLLLWNYLDGKPGHLLRGAMGHPGRVSFCIAENDQLVPSWPSLREDEGFPRGASTVTAYPSRGGPIPILMLYTDPEQILEGVAYHVSHASSNWGSYLLILNSTYARILAEAGWTKEQVRSYVKDRCRNSVAELKTKSRWNWPLSTKLFQGLRDPIEPGDHETYINFFSERDREKYRDAAGGTPSVDRRLELLVMVAGGDGPYFCFLEPYDLSTSPVTRAIGSPTT